MISLPCFKVHLSIDASIPPNRNLYNLVLRILHCELMCYNIEWRDLTLWRFRTSGKELWKRSLMERSKLYTDV